MNPAFQSTTSAPAGQPVFECQPATLIFLTDLGEAKAIYLRLKDLAMQQRRILENGFSEALLAVARRKEEEMGQLARLDHRLRSSRAAWDAAQPGLPDAERKLAQQTAAEVEATLKELLELEDENNRSILQQKDQTVGQIQRLNSARKYQKAYSQAALPGSLALDKKE